MEDETRIWLRTDKFYRLIKAAIFSLNMHLIEITLIHAISELDLSWRKATVRQVWARWFSGCEQNGNLDDSNTDNLNRKLFLGHQKVTKIMEAKHVINFLAADFVGVGGGGRWNCISDIVQFQCLDISWFPWKRCTFFIVLLQFSKDSCIKLRAKVHELIVSLKMTSPNMTNAFQVGGTRIKITRM